VLAALEEKGAARYFRNTPFFSSPDRAFRVRESLQCFSFAAAQPFAHRLGGKPRTSQKAI
jgi:hypothetical protein